MRLLFGEWTPDQPAHLSKGLQVASGVYPAANGYRPVGQFTVTQEALASACKGAAAFVSPGGIAIIIAGTSSNLYKAFANGWTSIGSGYSIQGDGRWRFAQFGGLAIATNGTDSPVKYDLTTSGLGSLGGSPPRMKLLAVVKDFLVGGVVDGDVTRLQWSGINDAEWWTAGQRQSDYQIMATGGEITGIVGGEFGLILQRSRITRMDYVGGNFIFDFNEISTNIGCVSEHSMVQSGQLAFWRSDNGFIMWDGATIKPIGNERVDRWFDSQYTKSAWSGASAAVDAKNNTVKWSMGDQIIAYNWVLDRWSLIPQAAELIFGGFALGVSLDELDAIYGDLESVTVTIDDEELIGGGPFFYAFNTSHEMGTFTGSNMAATLTMSDMEMAKGREVRLRSARPITDATGDLTLTLRSKARLGDAGTDTVYSSLTASGDMPVRERGRFVRPTLTHAAGSDWTYTQGIDLEGTAGARR